jgi:MYXO-CTERM domain-containing protein
MNHYPSAPRLRSGRTARFIGDDPTHETGGADGSFWDTALGTGLEKIGGQVFEQGSKWALGSIFGTGVTAGTGGNPPGTVMTATGGGGGAASKNSWLLPLAIAAGLLFLLKRRA